MRVKCWWDNTWSLDIHYFRNIRVLWICVGWLVIRFSDC